MGRLALIGGSSLTGSLVSGGARVEAEGERIEVRGVTLIEAETHVFCQRHGASGYTLPHEIDHGANLAALADRGCDRVLAIGSVGSLSEELGPGTFLAPDDFIALHLGLTTLDDERAHAVRKFDRGWRNEVVEAWTRSAGAPVRNGGVYWETVGPRLESAAEIRFIASHAHVVGMTIASECVIAAEIGLRYAAVCVVDNLANGIGRPLRTEDLIRNRAANLERLLEALEGVVPALAADRGAAERAGG